MKDCFIQVSILLILIGQAENNDSLEEPSTTEQKGTDDEVPVDEGGQPWFKLQHVEQQSFMMPISKRISGGKTVSEEMLLESMSFIVLLENSYFKKPDGTLPPPAVCGGTLITPAHVLTAQHCVVRKASNESTLYAGEIYVLGGTIKKRPDGNFDKYEKRYVSHVHVIAGFEKSSQYGQDIAVLELKDSFTSIKPAVLFRTPYNDDLHKNKEIWALGWGHTGARSSNILKWVYMETVPTDKCMREKDMTTIVKGREFCAEGHVLKSPPHSGTCKGDSGGPLLLKLPKGFRQIGVVSRGGSKKQCGISNMVTIFTDVASYVHDFISKAIEIRGRQGQKFGTSLPYVVHRLPRKA